jgi:hypothetical protein
MGIARVQQTQGYFSLLIKAGIVAYWCIPSLTKTKRLGRTVTPPLIIVFAHLRQSYPFFLFE